METNFCIPRRYHLVSYFIPTLPVMDSTPPRPASGQYASYWNAFLLPPSNEVWGKVMLLHLSVTLFTGVCPIACWDTPPRHTSPRQIPPGQTPSLWADNPPLGRQPPPPWQTSPHPPNTTGYGQQAGGTHPTGMHSCIKIKNNKNAFQ